MGANETSKSSKTPSKNPSNTILGRAFAGSLRSGSTGSPVEYLSMREGAMFPEELHPSQNPLAGSAPTGDFLQIRQPDQVTDWSPPTQHTSISGPPDIGVPRTHWDNFDEFYAAVYPRLLRLGVALVWSKAMAEDHLQDAFAKTYARFATLDEPEAYVRKTLVNEVRISFRRQQMTQRFAPLLRSTVIQTDRYTDDSLLKALDSLPLRQRAAVILRYYEQCSEQEIAHALNCRPGTVKSLLSRGLASLRKVVEHE
jgi:RNA polymerase sigma factor (sigma-70 family)